MNNNERAYNKLLKGVQDFVLAVVNKSADRTYTGIIKKNNGDGTYRVSVNRVEYDNVPTAIGNNCNVNETVYVMIPQGNISNIFILKWGK